MSESELHKTVRLFSGTWNEMYSYIDQVEESYAVDNLFGSSLSQYGSVFNITRLRKVDSEFQKTIKNFLKGRFSCGTKDDIEKYVCSWLNMNSSLLMFEEDKPGHFILNIPLSYYDTTLPELVDEIKPISVGYTILWYSAFWDESKWDEGVWGD